MLFYFVFRWDCVLYDTFSIYGWGGVGFTGTWTSVLVQVVGSTGVRDVKAFYPFWHHNNILIPTKI